MFTTTIESPIGPLVALADDVGLRRIMLPREGVRDGAHVDVRDDRAAHSVRESARDASEVGAALDAPDHPTLRALREQLREYFAGTRRVFALPLAPSGTAFQLLAWDALRAIPFGETRSYAQQARAIGRPAAVRAIGAANGRNPLPIVVPCHRVIGADGSLTGFGGGLPAKRFLLELEGVAVPPSYQGAGW